MRIEFRTLGATEILAVDDGGKEALQLPPKVRALLAFLTLARPRGLHSRDVLAALFWPELDQEHARSNLRRALYDLRQALGAELVIARGHEDVGLDRELLWCDAVALDDALEAGERETALDLYRGELLPGMSLSDSAEFERWLENERSRLQDKATATLQEVVEAAMEGGKPAEAARWLRRALTIDPHDEVAIRRLMKVRVALGDRAGALRAFEAFERRLAEDLELEPDDETKDVARSVRDREKPSARTVSLERELEVAEPPAVPAPAIPDLRPIWMLAAFAAVTLLIGWFIVGRDDSTTIAGVVDPSAPLPGIAVLPFTASGPDTEKWGEAMATLLSTSLDGVPGFRSIEERSLLAVSRREVPEGVQPDLATTLRVARLSGASYGVVGSVAVVPPGMRLAADVFDLVAGHKAGHAQVSGSPDSLFMLVDELSVEILGLLLRATPAQVPETPSISQTLTASLPALKAYLEGEALYRQNDFGQASHAYRRAIAHDSTFAMAYSRMSEVSGYLGSEWWRPDDPPFWEMALRYVDRLPDREATLVRAKASLHPAERLDLLRKATAKYPNDARFWHLLGELYFHDSASLLTDPRELLPVLTRAAELEPQIGMYRIHLFEDAMCWGDSARAARELAALTKVAPDDPFARHGPVTFALAFGDSTSRAKANAVMDTVSDFRGLLCRPRAFPVEEALARRELADPRNLGNRARVRRRLGHVLEWQGKLRAAYEQYAHPETDELRQKRHVYRLISLRGFEVPEVELERLLVIDTISQIDEKFLHRTGVAPSGNYPAATYAADHGHWDDHAAVVRWLRRNHGRLLQAGEQHANGLIQTANALEGYALWQRGHREEAVEVLAAARRRSQADAFMDEMTLWWLARLHLELGRPGQAVPYLRAIVYANGNLDPFAAYELGRIYEGSGNEKEAIEMYRFCLEAWVDPDPEIEVLADEARRGLAHVTGQIASSRP